MAGESYHDAPWEAVREGLDPRHLELRRTFLLQRVAAAAPREGPPPRVLDLGCGEGRFTAELARAGATAVGVDVSHEALRRARARYPELDLRTIPPHGSWPLGDAGFDIVWAGETIEHVADTTGWLAAVR